jgi:hypothetical protein
MSMCAESMSSQTNSQIKTEATQMQTFTAEEFINFKVEGDADHGSAPPAPCCSCGTASAPVAIGGRRYCKDCTIHMARTLVGGKYAGSGITA